METIEIDGEQYVQAADMAKEKGVTLPGIHRAIKSGRLTGVMRIGRMLVPRAEAEAWQKQQRGGNRGGGRKKKTE